MANQHFGNIGDVWKHLPLAEVLEIAEPGQYWESHAGSTGYLLTQNAARDFGVFHFLEHADSEPALRDSVYRRLLTEAAGSGRVPETYPGSPALAMRLLRRRVTRFAFCDVDGDSLMSIDATARQMELSSGVVTCIAQDGVSTMLRRVEELASDQVNETLLLIDPFRISTVNAKDQSPLDLFAAAVERGIMTVLWYCARSRPETEIVHDALRTSIDSIRNGRPVEALWCGEIELGAMDEVGFEPPGIGMCGLLCAHLPAPVIRAVRDQGEALTRIYEHAALPNGMSGTLRFSEPCTTQPAHDWFNVDVAPV